MQEWSTLSRFTIQVSLVKFVGEPRCVCYVYTDTFVAPWCIVGKIKLKYINLNYHLTQYKRNMSIERAFREMDALINSIPYFIPVRLSSSSVLHAYDHSRSL